MQYADRHESFFISAKTVAKRIVDTLTKDDDAVIIGCSGIALQVLPELDYDKKHILNSIELLQPGFVTTHIATALDTAVEVLTTAKSPVKRIFLLTDLTRNGWDPSWFKSGHEKLRRHVSKVHIIDISEGKTRKNIAITRVEPRLDILERNAEGQIKVTISNFSPAAAADAPVPPGAFIISGSIEVAWRRLVDCVRDFAALYLGNMHEQNRHFGPGPGE